MSYTSTLTQTWSKTEARYVAGKVAADLRQMQQAYQKPSDALIELFAQEMTVLLSERYLKEVAYGFKRQGSWVLALKYIANTNGTLADDERSGRVPRGVDIAGADFYSLLSLNDSWDRLTITQQREVEGRLPFVRNSIVSSGPAGAWQQDKTYSISGSGLVRTSVGGAR